MSTFFRIVWRSLIIGFAYTIANMAIGICFNQIGWEISTNASKAPSALILITFISGFLMGITLGPIASILNTSRMQSAFTWMSIIFMNLLSVTIEGYFFAPGLIQPEIVPRILVLQFISTLVCGIAISYLFRCRYEPSYHIVTVQRPWHSWTWRFILSAASYLAFYFVFGFINYELVTRPYYETHGSLAVPGFNTVIKVASIRSIVIIASILPLIMTLHVPRNKMAYICGMILFSIGGLIPLSMQIGILPTKLLIASGAEILAQNFLTGIVAASLLGRWRTVKVRKPSSILQNVGIEEECM